MTYICLHCNAEFDAADPRSGYRLPPWSFDEDNAEVRCAGCRVWRAQDDFVWTRGKPKEMTT